MRSLPVLSALTAAAWLASCAPGPASHPRAHSRYGDAETIDVSAIQGDTAFDRAAYGKAPLPFWSELTPAEVRVLQGRDQAAAGDAHALLGLAILASGDRRGDTGYAAITARFDAFVAKEGAALAGIKDPDRKAERLLRAMHASFFKHGYASSGPQPGYDYDQSALTGIFTDGRFNCVSSAILYLLLAREFGFTAQGAVMPRHAYAHLIFADGRSAEVETTTPDGYEKAHPGSEAPVRPKQWYRNRGLDPMLALDYAKRKLVDPIGLLGYNMRNQHVVALSLRDRYRIMEAGAWTMPEDPVAQGDRMAVYELEYRYLSSRKEWAVLDRMFLAIGPLMPGIHARMASDPARADHPAWLAYSRAQTDRESGRLEDAIAWGDSALAWIPPQGDSAGIIHGNVMGVLMKVSQAMAEAGRIAAAETLLLRYPVFLDDSLPYRSNLAWVYSKLSHAAWAKKDWAGVIAALEKGVVYARTEDKAPMRDNLAGAYYNRALGFKTRGEDRKAEETLRRCREKAPGAKACLNPL